MIANLGFFSKLIQTSLINDKTLQLKKTPAEYVFDFLKTTL